jgi:hypothetical protein
MIKLKRRDGKRSADLIVSSGERNHAPEKLNKLPSICRNCNKIYKKVYHIFQNHCIVSTSNNIKYAPDNTFSVGASLELQYCLLWHWHIQTISFIDAI